MEAVFEELQVAEITDKDILSWRKFTANKGEGHRGHKHLIDHVTLLVSGSLKLTYKNRIENYAAPASIYIDKELDHELTATSDNTVWLCTFLIPEGGNPNILSREA